MRLVSLLLLLTISVTAYGMSSTKGVDKSAVEPGYQTLQGQLYEEGTGTISMLILKAEDGNDYLVKTNAKQIHDELRNLKGLPILLTGKVTVDEGTYQLGNNKSVDLYQGQLELKTYNLAHDLSKEQATVLGRLEQEGERLVVLTRDQYIIELDPDTYHSLDQYLGGQIVVRGEIKQLNNYRYRMQVNGFRTFD